MISFIRKIYEENSKIVFKFLLILIIVILTVVVSVRQNASNEIDLGAAKETDKVSAEETSEKEYYVDISGEVKKPGLQGKEENPPGVSHRQGRGINRKGGFGCN